MVLMDLATQSAYAGRHDEAARYEATFAALVERTGSVTGRALLAYVRGECRAERGDPAATRYLEEAVTVAEEAELSFAAGVARHTLVTSSARAAGDPAAVLPTLGPLIDHWHGFGSWTQLWMAVRVLVETLSRLGCHREATVLLGRWPPVRGRRGCTAPTPGGSTPSRPPHAPRSATPSRPAGPRGPRSGTSRPSPSPAVSPAPPRCRRAVPDPALASGAEVDRAAGPNVSVHPFPYGLRGLVPFGMRPPCRAFLYASGRSSGAPAPTRHHRCPGSVR